MEVWNMLRIIVNISGTGGEGKGDRVPVGYDNINILCYQYHLERSNCYQYCIGKPKVYDSCMKCIGMLVLYCGNVRTRAGKTNPGTTPTPPVRIPCSVGKKPVKKR